MAFQVMVMDLPPMGEGEAWVHSGPVDTIETARKFMDDAAEEIFSGMYRDNSMINFFSRRGDFIEVSYTDQTRLHFFIQGVDN